MKTFLEPLTKEEEVIYVNRCKEGDQKAKDILIERNLRLVAHIAKKYHQGEREMEELISVGTVGLIKAINTFDNTKGNRLVTYASKCIENEILMMIRSERKRMKEISLYEPIKTDRDGNEISLLDIIEFQGKDVLDEYDKWESIEWLRNKMNILLTEREKTILILRYGLSGKEELTQREVAKRLNISRSYVSRIEKKALEKLRKSYYGR